MAITKLNNKAVANVTTLPVALGDMVLVSSATASSSASIEFTLGNYKEYQFYFVNMHPSVDDAFLMMNFSTDNGSNYNVTKTSTFFFTYHSENDAFQNFTYGTSFDLAQSTANQYISDSIGTSNDNNASGYFKLFNPSNTTYVKHWISVSGVYIADNYAGNQFSAGYGNTTSAANAVQFKMSSGNMDGTIYLYGIK